MAQNIDRDLNQIEEKIVSDISLKRREGEGEGEGGGREIYLAEGGSIFYPLKRCFKLANRYFIYGHI
jgi:hypothetical protein